MEDIHPMVQAEFQLWREEALLLRAVRQNPSSRLWTQEVQLKPGRYLLQLFTWTSEGQAPRVHKQFLDIGDQRELHIRF